MVDIFDKMYFDNHESVVFCSDKVSGLKAIIAIHDTTLGPALGGCRFYPYVSGADALEDVLRLSKGMTYKAAITGLQLGGGKAVIIGDPKQLASKDLFTAFGRFVNDLGGKYITAEDVGTNTRFMEWIRAETNHVVGVPDHLGGLGDPSPYTAHGVFCGIKAAIRKVNGSDGLAGLKIAVEGVGNVGYNLCKELHASGAKLYVSDINTAAAQRAVQDFNATIVKGKEIYGLDVDVYAPCALGATINDETIPQFKCSIIAGAANNQLQEEIHGEKLAQRGILYAPDYVVNAGGLIHVHGEFAQESKEQIAEKIENIYVTSMHIFALAEKEKVSMAQAANKIAEQRIAGAKNS
jgi:leucine dehydrogenase